MESIAVKVPLNEGDFDIEKVARILSKFEKACHKADAGQAEIGAAIAVLVHAYLETYDAIPLSERVMELVRESKMYELGGEV